MELFLNNGNITKKSIQLLNTWCREQRQNQLESALFDILCSTAYPFQIALKLLDKSDNKKKPKSLGFYMIAALKRYLNDENLPDDNKQVSESIKRDCIPVLCKLNRGLACQLFDLFQVNKVDSIKNSIEQYFSSQEPSTAIFLIACFKLQCCEYTDRFIIPLLLNNIPNLVETYLEDYEAGQRYILELLDMWMKEPPAADLMKKVTASFLQPKNLAKLILRWSTKYSQLSVGMVFPNLQQFKLEQQIRFALYRWYREDSISASALNELIRKYIGDSSDLLRSTRGMISSQYKDPYHASILSEAFSSSYKWRCELQVWSEEEEGFFGPYLQLDLPSERILMVDSLDKLDECDRVLHAEEREGKKKIVGFDSEWSSDVYGNEVLALLQLATHDCVFLIDVYSFRQLRLMEHLDRFISDLFRSSRTVKIGFGTLGDLRLFRHHFPSMPDQPSHTFDLLDLRMRHATLLPDPDPQATCNDPHGRKVTGLNRLVYTVLGARLNKNEQISDWERRPLRTAQINYAALDAFSLVQVYNEVEKGAEKQLYRLMLDEMRKPHQKESSAKREKKKEKEDATPFPPKSARATSSADATTTTTTASCP